MGIGPPHWSTATLQALENPEGWAEKRSASGIRNLASHTRERRQGIETLVEAGRGAELEADLSGRE